MGQAADSMCLPLRQGGFTFKIALYVKDKLPQAYNNCCTSLPS